MYRCLLLFLEVGRQMKVAFKCTSALSNSIQSSKMRNNFFLPVLTEPFFFSMLKRRNFVLSPAAAIEFCAWFQSSDQFFFPWLIDTERTNGTFLDREDNRVSDCVASFHRPELFARWSLPTLLTFVFSAGQANLFALFFSRLCDCLFMFCFKSTIFLFFFSSMWCVWYKHRSN